MSDMTITLPLKLHVRDDQADALKAHAAKLDDEYSGEHMATYTIEQAVTVILLQDPEFLFHGRTAGWEVLTDQVPGLSWDGAEWVDANGEEARGPLTVTAGTPAASCARPSGCGTGRGGWCWSPGPWLCWTSTGS